jgi:predicted DCC family thiol-disulfide oxidoreductase YuxK
VAPAAQGGPATITVLGWLAAAVAALRLTLRLLAPRPGLEINSWLEHLSWFVWAALAGLGASVLVWNPEARNGLHMYGLAIDAESLGRWGAQTLRSLELPTLALLGFFWYVVQFAAAVLAIVSTTRRLAWRLSILMLGLAWYFGGLRWDLVAFIALWWSLLNPKWWSPRLDGELTVVFDGECNLCNRSVNLLFWSDPRALLRVATLQSDWGRSTLERFDIQADSVVATDGTRIWLQSDAVIEILRSLGGLSGLVAGLIALIPRPFREATYRGVARHRIKWFGRSPVCRLPTEDDRRRFRS